jgi:hypothetical protein
VVTCEGINDRPLQLPFVAAAQILVVVPYPYDKVKYSIRGEVCEKRKKRKWLTC